MLKYFLSLIFVFFFAITAVAQDLSNKVEGLELPPNQIVNYDEGFVNVQAKSKGIVKWLVVSLEGKVKYIVGANSVIVGVPINGGIVTVYAVALVDNKLTDFVSCNIVVKTPVDPSKPDVTLTAPKPQEPMHVSFVMDFSTASPETIKMLNSPTLKKFITEAGCHFRILDSRSSTASSRKLDTIVNRLGGPSLIIQKGDGSLAIPAQRMPKTEEEIIKVIKSLRG